LNQKNSYYSRNK